jgi:hypothetical protein
MQIRRKIAALTMAAVLPLTLVACGTSDDDATTTSTESTSLTVDSAADNQGGGGPGNSVDVSSVTTEDQLIALIQEAYGDGSLGLHRGHQPIESVLDEVLQISHDELHVRMEEQGQNLAAVAEDLGIDPQALIDALVASWSPAIDSLVDAGTITADEGDTYLAALEEAFAWRVSWDGSEATPTFTGV